MWQSHAEKIAICPPLYLAGSLHGLHQLAVPLLIGARDVAFPRLNALSYWLFLAGGLILNSSYLLGAAANAGCFGYAPLTSTPFLTGLNSALRRDVESS